MNITRFPAMKTSKLAAAAILAAAAFSTGAFAQSPAANPPSGPGAPAPDRIVYVPQMPTVAELAGAAKAQGLAVARIEQTADSVTVVYAAPNGQATTVVYHPISAAESEGVPVPQPGAPAPGTPAPAATAVVYQSPGYYYPYPYAYYPYGYWPPVAIGLRFGWGFHGGGWHR